MATPLITAPGEKRFAFFETDNQISVVNKTEDISNRRSTMSV